MMIHAIFPLLLLLHLAASETASITQAAVFASQRPCAQGCFTYDLSEGPDRLAQAIGCDYDNPPNECFCRPDLQADADAFLQSCVNRECSQNTLDTNSATSIYDEYCTGAGFLRNTPTMTTSARKFSQNRARLMCALKADSSTTLFTPPTPSSSSFQSQDTLHTSQTSPSKASNSVEDPSSPTVDGETPVSAPTNSAAGGNSGGGGNSLGTGEIIGIVVGVAGFIATAIGTWQRGFIVMLWQRWNVIRLNFFPGSGFTPLVNETLAKAAGVLVDSGINGGNSTGRSRTRAINPYARLFYGDDAWDMVQYRQEAVIQAVHIELARVTDHRIWALAKEESKGCVCIPTTGNGIFNPGLMQSHNGAGTCAGVNPCPQSQILQMIRDGTAGTPPATASSRSLLKRLPTMAAISLPPTTLPPVSITAALWTRYSYLENGFSSIACYASGIANRAPVMDENHACTIEEIGTIKTSPHLATPSHLLSTSPHLSTPLHTSLHLSTPKLVQRPTYEDLFTQADLPTHLRVRASKWSSDLATQTYLRRPTQTYVRRPTQTNLRKPTYEDLPTKTYAYGLASGLKT
ncbi:hypothetical protein CHU98_g5198 [Xylaria longipes]|nr:hypothetical protein CHU98_g5198 [Xylaria longipes]